MTSGLVRSAGSGRAYYRGLDGLRGFAILIVLLEHWWGLKQILPFGGAVGVNIFFVLSGFLITEILLQQRDAPVGAALKNFWWRRTLRIFPVYYVYLAALLLLAVPGAWTLLPWSSTYSLNIYASIGGERVPRLMSHLWSLGVEEQFYLLWPMVVLMTPDRWLKRSIFALPFVGLFVRIFVFQVGLSSAAEIAYMSMPAALDALGIGAVVAFIKTRRPENWLTLTRTRWIPAFVLPASLAAAILMAHTNPDWYPIAERSVSALLGGSLVVIVLGGAQSRRMRGVRAVRAVLRNRVLAQLGRISYGVYVYHLLAEYFLAAPLAAALGHYAFFGSKILEYNAYFISAPIFIAISLVMATVSYTLMERPLRRWKGLMDVRA